MTDDENKEKNSDSLPFYKNTWFWVAVFFAVVCIVGSLTGDFNSNHTDPLENGREFESADAVSTLVQDETVGKDENLPSSTSEVGESEAESAPKEESTEAVTEIEWDGKTVYTTPSGKRYHIKESCAGQNAVETDIDSAKENYTPCGRCAKLCADNSEQ